MSDGRRPFWSSIPGLITGVAGLLTGVVGLITLLVQQGVIGDKSSSDKPGATVTTAGGPTVGGAGGASTTEVGSFTLSPKPLDFGPTDQKVKLLTVKNTSVSATITLRSPQVVGADADRFLASFDTCSSAPLVPGLSCTVKVTFSPNGPLRQYKAALQIQPLSGAVRGDEVQLTASTLL